MQRNSLLSHITVPGTTYFQFKTEHFKTENKQKRENETDMVTYLQVKTAHNVSLTSHSLNEADTGLFFTKNISMCCNIEYAVAEDLNES